jgi:hypothetical protein
MGETRHRRNELYSALNADRSQFAAGETLNGHIA